MSPPFQLLVAIALPIAAIYSLIGGGRLVNWITEQQTRAPAPQPIERVQANLVRLRAQLEAMETRTRPAGQEPAAAGAPRGLR